MRGPELLARDRRPAAPQRAGQREEHAELVGRQVLELGFRESRQERSLRPTHVLGEDRVGPCVFGGVGRTGEDLEREARVPVGDGDAGDLVEHLAVEAAGTEREFGPRREDLREVLPGVGWEGEPVGDAEARTARGVQVREEVLRRDEQQRDRSERDLVGAGEEVDQLGFLLDQRCRLVEEDDQMLGPAAQALLEDVDHLREAVPPVRQGDVHGPEQVEHDRPVARPSPAVDVGGPDGELVATAGPFEVAREPAGECGLPAPDPAGQQEVGTLVPFANASRNRFVRTWSSFSRRTSRGGR